MYFIRFDKEKGGGAATQTFHLEYYKTEKRENSHGYFLNKISILCVHFSGKHELMTIN